MEPLIRVIAVGQPGAPDCVDREDGTAFGRCAGAFASFHHGEHFICALHSREAGERNRLRYEQVRAERAEASRRAREAAEHERERIASVRLQKLAVLRDAGRKGAAAAARNRRHRALAAWWPTLRGYS